MVQRIWFDRQFELGFPAEAFPDIVERLRGTPARLEERLVTLAADVVATRDSDAWSMQEHVGHLWDLEPLWFGRLNDLLAGTPELRPADLENRKTHEADHNNAQLRDLLSEFRSARMDFVARLDGLAFEDLARTALHPRLQQPMNMVDLCFFVAEHDDHHLARVTGIIKNLG